jgi:hypothetical protein
MKNTVELFGTSVPGQLPYKNAFLQVYYFGIYFSVKPVATSFKIFIPSSVN